MTGRRGGSLSRRDFLVRAGAFGAAGLVLPSVLDACAQYSGGSVTDKHLSFDNWPAYIDDATVGDFNKASGYDLKYTEGFNDNNEYFAKIVPSLARKKLVQPDILAPTFWMTARMINLGWVQPLPLDRMPNARKYLRKDLRDPVWDPTGRYSLPWQTGMTGIAYNKKVTGGKLTSIHDLLDKRFRGKVSVLTEMRDTIGLLLMGEGKKPSEITSFDDASGAFETLDKAKKDGQIRAFTGNEYLSGLSTGNYAVCVAWSGDILQIQQDSPNVEFLIPEEGGMSWADTMVWMKGSKRRDAVAAWMNWCYDPEHAAQITDYVQYVPPVEGVQDVIRANGETMMKAAKSKADKEAAQAEIDLSSNPLLFPDAATTAKLQAFNSLAPEVEQEFSVAFSKIAGA